MAAVENSTQKKITTTNEMKQMMSEYYYELDSATKSKDKKVAWCSSVGPAEILRSLGFYVYFPENHGAMLGTSRMATDLIPYANAIGYSPDFLHPVFMVKITANSVISIITLFIFCPLWIYSKTG